MVILKGINAALAFLLELAMLFALGYWGYQRERSIGLQWTLAIGLPLLVALVWGIFLAPKAYRRLSLAPGALLSLGLFLLAALALYHAKQPVAAVVLAVAAIVNRVLVLLWQQW